MNKAGLDAKTHLPGSKYRGIGWKWLVRWNGRAPGGYFDCAMLLALLCTVHVLILNICMFCDRIRLKGKLAKRQSIKIDGILKFNIIALHCLPPISDLGQSRTNGVLWFRIWDSTCFCLQFPGHLLIICLISLMASEWVWSRRFPIVYVDLGLAEPEVFWLIFSPSMTFVPVFPNCV